MKEGEGDGQGCMPGCEYFIGNHDKIDSPALVVYEDRVRDNIRLAVSMAGDVSRLRPHVKTHKMAAVCSMMMEEGISRFKCATIAEAEMLAMVGAPDVLLAYQPVGPKVGRLRRLVETYPGTLFSCLTDNGESASFINSMFEGAGARLNIFIDVNVGMGRTGVSAEDAPGLSEVISRLPNLRLTGIHGYDGHIHHADLKARKEEADKSFGIFKRVYEAIRPSFPYPLIRVMGGTPTFPVHIRREGVECSPGTFVFWDMGYGRAYPDMPFKHAALVMGRVVSRPDMRRICIDTGYKSVASENPLPRIYFLNAPGIVPVSHSEEHLVAEGDGNPYPPGSVLYGVPEHICPTVALYEKAFVIKDGVFSSIWPVTARNRFITI
ncbi:MAG: D-TA family PLP-dependent enzyme [Tannerellaceae bacterium]|jgi:D-serine deaminase-like pyridoxal phosphate-dependent protein|nr:D-TA family PLP-dependent enzyme [Tannerellaceae bacterium]